MSKKLLIPLIILAVLGATGFGIFLASSQSARPADQQNSAQQNNTLTISEIDRTFTVPNTLGKATYQMNGPISILIYSSAYENLDGCAGHHLGELLLTDAQAQDTFMVGGQHTYAKFISQPMGKCGNEQGVNLAEALSSMVHDGR